MARAKCKNTKITAHFIHVRKFLPRYRYDAHKSVRERQNAGFFTASLGVRNNTMSAPSVFISYSHDSAEHKAWVLKLATDLRAAGIDASLDQ
jgi:histidyl-tRNA synthetase